MAVVVCIVLFSDFLLSCSWFNLLGRKILCGLRKSLRACARMPVHVPTHRPHRPPVYVHVCVHMCVSKVGNRGPKVTEPRSNHGGVGWSNRNMYTESGSSTLGVTTP
jgi:hypothetical protein